MRLTSVSVPFQPFSNASGLFPDCFESPAVGVGQDPDAFASVRGANCGRCETSPFRIEPHFGKIGKDVRQSEPNKSGDVLQEDESGSYVSHDPGNVWPEPSLIIRTELLACAAEWLAGETGSDEIHSATPRAAVEGCEIVPDRRLIQVRLFHTGDENGRCVAVPLNTSHGSYVDSGQTESELEASVSVAEADGT